MADFLTERNGVVCTSCFFTIDLTEVKTEEYPKLVKVISRIMGKPDWFMVVCSHCQKKHSYRYNEVRPISNLGKKLEELNKEEISPQFRSKDYDN